MAPIIRVSEVSKRFVINRETSVKDRLLNRKRAREHRKEFWALDDVSFELEPAKTLGLIGANGSGKSTLLKIIGGILIPDNGFVERRGRLAALLELGSGFHGDLSGRENVYLNASILGFSRKQTEALFDAIVDFSGVEEFIDTQVKFYSSGMYVRLAFAVAVHVDPDIMLVDEVLSVGDEPFQRKCMERIKQFQRDGKTIIFVTHGLDIVRQLCDRVIMLEHGKVVVDGTPVDALRHFRDRYEQEVVALDEFGTRRLEFRKVQVTNGSGVPQDRFSSGEQLGIEMDIEANAPTDDWAVGVAIFNHLDVMVFGTNTKLQQLSLPPIDGPRRVRFTFDEIPMIEGQYMVTVALHSRDEVEQYHRVERIASFRVFSPPTVAGVLHMKTAFEILPD